MTGLGGPPSAAFEPLPLAASSGVVSVAGPWKVRSSMLSEGSLYVVGRGFRTFGPADFCFSLPFFTGCVRVEPSKGVDSPTRKEPSAARGRVAVVVFAQSGTIYGWRRADLRTTEAPRRGGEVAGAEADAPRKGGMLCLV